MISSGSMWMSFIFDRKTLTLLTECGDVLTRGLRISARYFDKLYVGIQVEKQLVGEDYYLCEFLEVRRI